MGFYTTPRLKRPLGEDPAKNTSANLVWGPPDDTWDDQAWGDDLWQPTSWSDDSWWEYDYGYLVDEASAWSTSMSDQLRGCFVIATGCTRFGLIHQCSRNPPT